MSALKLSSLVAAVFLVCASSASAAPVKRLAWAKASAQWTAAAKKKGYAVSCSTWTADRSTMTCTFFDAKVDPHASTIVAGVRHRTFGKVDVSRYDQHLTDVGVEPHAGCTYLVRLFGPSLQGDSRVSVLDVCAARWWVRPLPLP